MEPMQQLEAWNKQITDNPKAMYADIAVAKRLLKHGVEALTEVTRLRGALGQSSDTVKELRAENSKLRPND